MIYNQKMARPARNARNITRPIKNPEVLAFRHDLKKEFGNLAAIEALPDNQLHSTILYAKEAPPVNDTIADKLFYPLPVTGRFDQELSVASVEVMGMINSAKTPSSLVLKLDDSNRFLHKERKVIADRVRRYLNLNREKYKNTSSKHRLYTPRPDICYRPHVTIARLDPSWRDAHDIIKWTQEQINQLGHTALILGLIELHPHLEPINRNDVFVAPKNRQHPSSERGTGTVTVRTLPKQRQPIPPGLLKTPQTPRSS